MTEPVWLDGTQDLPPQPMLPDPLAGLLTGEVLPGVAPESWRIATPVPPPVPRSPAINAAFAEPPRRKRQPRQAAVPARQSRVPAAGFRPQVRQRPPRNKAGVVLITWVVTLFILFLIVRAVMDGVGGN